MNTRTIAFLLLSLGFVSRAWAQAEDRITLQVSTAADGLPPDATSEGARLCFPRTRVSTAADGLPPDATWSSG